MIVPVQPPLGTLASNASSHKAAPIGGKAPPPFTFVPVSCLPSRPGGRWPPALPRQGRHPLAERLRRHFLLYLFQPALPVKEARFQEPQMLCASDATSKNLKCCAQGRDIFVSRHGARASTSIYIYYQTAPPAGDQKRALPLPVSLQVYVPTDPSYFIIYRCLHVSSATSATHTLGQTQPRPFALLLVPSPLPFIIPM